MWKQLKAKPRSILKVTEKKRAYISQGCVGVLRYPDVNIPAHNIWLPAGLLLVLV